MSLAKTTKWLFGITVLLMIAWDVFAYLAGENATISVLVTDLSYYTPWVPLICGFIMGHWFWPARGSKD